MRRDNMVTKELEVVNELGLHARVASRIVREARKFESSVLVQKEGKSYDLKNVIGVITVNAKKGDVLTVEFEGTDEIEAAEVIEKLFTDRFGEK
jgi:phosphocarrier protein